jgi:S-(hydroxymethyl)glutathione dehydrogenase / alcohol dehydrogenase
VPADTVATVGVGGIGMSALQGAVLSGAKHVIAIDPVDFKREQAIKSAPPMSTSRWLRPSCR